MQAAVGPLSTAPPTIGLTATTGAGACASASVIPGIARIGPIEITGLDGPTMMARAVARAARTSRVGAAAPAPSKRMSSIGPVPRRADHELLQAGLPAAGAHAGPDRHIRHREDAGVLDAERQGQLRQGLGERRALGEAPRALQADGEIPVAEIEPDLLAEVAQAVHHVKGVAVQAPAPGVDAIGQPVGAEVGIGGDVGPVDLDVVAGVGDDHEVSTGLVAQAAGQLGAAGAPG